MVAFRFIQALKTYGWLVNLVLIAAGSYFVAGAANTVVAQSIRVVPSADDNAVVGATRAPVRRGAVSFSRISERNLFGAKKDPEVDPDAPVEVEEVEPGRVTGTDYKESELKKCSIPATVRATLVAEDNPQWSMAVLYSNSTREPEVYSIIEGQNEISNDATLIEIRNRAIVVRRTEHFELCSADDEEKTLTSSRARPTVARSRGGDEEEDAEGQVKKTGANEYEVDKEYIDQTMGNLSQVATQARIVPSFKNGKSNGFKLFSIKPGSIYQKIGLQNGDVIQKINGYSIDSPDKALEVYSKLKTSRNVNIELLRRGRALSKSYSIR